MVHWMVMAHGLIFGLLVWCRHCYWWYCHQRLDLYRLWTSCHRPCCLSHCQSLRGQKHCGLVGSSIVRVIVLVIGIGSRLPSLSFCNFVRKPPQLNSSDSCQNRQRKMNFPKEKYIAFLRATITGGFDFILPIRCMIYISCNIHMTISPTTCVVLY